LLADDLAFFKTRDADVAFSKRSEIWANTGKDHNFVGRANNAVPDLDNISCRKVSGILGVPGQIDVGVLV
jgi:hypothetical protein